MRKWLDASSSSNRYQQTYIKGFLDISGGNLILRNNNLHVLTGDASFGNNVYITGNTTIKSKLIVQDLSINGNSTITFQDNSIPASAIIGGIPASTGVFNIDVSFQSNAYVGSNLNVNGNSVFYNDASFNNRIFVSQIYENGNSLAQTYAPIYSPTFTGTVTFTGDVSGLNANMVGLSNVQNTSDMNKPVSTATFTALSAKVNVTDASLVGVPRAPTASNGTNTNQIATTEFVNNQIGITVGNPPSTMNTLQSLASALNNDPSFGTNLTTTVNASLLNKAPIDRPSFLNYVYIPKLFLTSDASFAGKLFVAGDVSMNGNIKAKTVYEGGNSLITKYATLASPIFTGKVVSTNDVSLNANLVVSGNVNAYSQLYLNGDASFGSRLMVGKTMNVLGDVSLNSRLLVSNDVSLNNNLFVGGNTTINNTFIVGNTFTASSNNIVVNTDASFTNNVDISGAIIAHNNMSLYGVINQQGVNMYDGYYTTFDSAVISDVSSIKTVVNISSGSTNTIIGNNAGVTSGNNVTVIGNNASPSTNSVSNEITLGNSSVNVLRCAATAITAVSDERDKTMIEELTIGMDFIKELKPVQFEWAMRDGGKVGQPDYGFIAQDLLEVERKTGFVVPNLVNVENPDRYEACYAKLLPIMVKAIQELENTVNELRNELQELRENK